MTMTGKEELRAISSQDLFALGVQGIAYVRPVSGEEGTLYSVHSADGRQLGVFDDLELAFVAVHQNGMELVNVH
ncbi:MAG: DUF1150 family protein [Alphaproteobacteria bacterium]|nr:DUF1150 family protein [Alphaproteobacteria bacterium]